MLHIILLILKIIGIILLCILGIVLFAVCCALFVPVRYRVEVLREEGEGKPPAVVRAKITWLMHLVNISLCYPADVYVRARIFLFTLFRLPEAEKQKETGRQEKKQEEKDTGQAGPKTEETSSEAVTACPDGGADDKTKAGEPEENIPEVNGSDKTGQEDSGIINKIIRKIHDFIDKIKQAVIKMKAAFENIQYTIRHLCDKIKSMSDTIQYYREVIESEPFRQSWILCRKQAGSILKGLKPDRFEAELVVGTKDPATTGEILAIYGMLYPFIGQHVQVTGDFEKAHIEGWVYIKGKVRAITFLRAAVRVYMNKNFRALIRLLKKEAV